MKTGMKNIVRFFAVFTLITAMIIPMCVPAFARASDYLMSFGGSVYNSGSTVYVSFFVTGAGTMEDIGALSITVYKEDGTWVKTFQHDTTSGMIDHNTGFHAGTVSFTGDANTTYKANVGIYAGKNGGSDTRYFWVYES